MLRASNFAETMLIAAFLSLAAEPTYQSFSNLYLTLRSPTACVSSNNACDRQPYVDDITGWVGRTLG